MKLYGVLDGVVLGLSAGAIVMGALLASGSSSWLGWGAAVAAVLLVAALFLAARLGRGMVDGTFLAPWMRGLSLLVTALAAVAGVVVLVQFLNPPKEPEAAGASPPPDLVAERCRLLAGDLASLGKRIDDRVGEVVTISKELAALRYRTKRCARADQSTVQELYRKLQVWDGEVNTVRLVPALPPELPKVAPTQPGETLPKGVVPVQPDYAGILPVEPPPEPPPENAEPPDPTVVITVTEERRRGVFEWILSIFGGGVSLGSKKITTADVLGETVVAESAEGRNAFAEMLGQTKDRPDRRNQLLLAYRKLANDSSTEPETKARLQAILDAQPVSDLACHYVLSTVDTGIDRAAAETLAVNAGEVKEKVDAVLPNQWKDFIDAVVACVADADPSHYEFYTRGIEDLGEMRR